MYFMYNCMWNPLLHTILGQPYKMWSSSLPLSYILLLGLDQCDQMLKY